MENTFSIEENARESERLYALLDGGIREKLMKYPGVRHVSVGLKISGDELIWERCFHVYVDKKVDAGELKKEDMVPAEIDGIKTDVHKIGGESLTAVCEDTNTYRPLRGGISITNGLEELKSGYQSGTLGVIGRVKGICKCNVMALTNWHVLYVGKGKPFQTVTKGSRVFQPKATTNDNLIIDDAPDPETTENDIGKVVVGIYDETVDCALLEINRSCCNCCGIESDNVINKLKELAFKFDGISGAAKANTGDDVFFVGATSGPTRALVVSDSAPARIKISYGLIADPKYADKNPLEFLVMEFINQIRLQLKDKIKDEKTGKIIDLPHACNSVATPPEGYTGPQFSRVVNHGDSGSLLINKDNKAVGLVFASDKITPEHSEKKSPFTLHGYANHYGAVVTALAAKGYDFEINYTQPKTGGSHGAALVDFEEPDGEIFLAWKKRIEAHPKTRAIADAVARHRDEVILLVNHCRPVMVAWHRGKGPAFAAILADNIREEKFEFPNVVNGVRAEQLLSRMRDVLLVHGSHSLKDDLEKFGDEILAAVRGENNFEDLLLVLTG